MRFYLLAIILAAAVLVAAQTPTATPATQTFTVTLIAENVDARPGNIGVLVFKNEKGWPEDRAAALRDIVVPAHQGNVTVNIPDLPAGDYAIVVLHDVNQNHKMDRNWLSKPQEQWGMTNNPHALIKAPAYAKARFTLKGDTELHVQLQQ